MISTIGRYRWQGEIFSYVIEADVNVNQYYLTGRKPPNYQLPVLASDADQFNTFVLQFYWTAMDYETAIIYLDMMSEQYWGEIY